jgi:uncharacterized glyoxalase superfamily protein PhnB
MSPVTNGRPDGYTALTPYLVVGGAGRLQLSNPQPAFGLIVPERGGAGISPSVMVYVSDVDATIAKAAELGAEVTEEPSDFVSGGRFGAFVVPFGRRWAVMTRVAELAPGESERRVEEWWQGLSAPVSNQT